MPPVPLPAAGSPPAHGLQSRVEWADYARGICIVLVVMMHATLGVEAATGQTGFMHLAVEFAKPFRMPDFFLISGLFLSRVIDRDWRLYLDRKVVHFLYFYVLWMLIQGAFKWPALGLSEGPGAVFEAFLLAFVEPFGTLWFIYLLPIFFVVAKLVRHVPPLLVLAVGAVLEMAQPQTGWIVADEFAHRFFFFLVGWYAAPYIFAFAERAGRAGWLTIAGLIGWALLNAMAVHVDIATLPGISILLGLAGSAAVIATAALLAHARPVELLRYAGEHSIAVYLAFFLPMAVTRIVLVRTGVIEDTGWISLIVTLAAVICPLILYWLVERTGHGRFLFGRPAAFHIAGKPQRLSAAE